MIIYNPNIFSIAALPFWLLTWITEAYLFLATIRLILSRIPTASATCQRMSSFTDPAPNALRNWLSAKRSRPVPMWFSWLLVCILAVLVRQLLIVIIFRLL